MKRPSWVGEVGVVLLLVSCGARTELSDQAPQAQTGSESHFTGPVSSRPDSEQPERGGGSDPRRGAPSIWDNEILPSCVRGTPPVPYRRCAFEVDGLCYETDVEACACVECESHLCVWGLPDDNGTYPFKYCQ